MPLTELTRIKGPGIHTESNIVSHNINSTGIVTATVSAHVGTGITLSHVGNATYTGIVTATKFIGDGSELTGVVQSDTPLGNSTSSTVFYESDYETTISSDTTLSRASSNPGVINTKFQQVVVAPTKSLIVDAGETFVVDAYGLRTPDI